MTEFDRLAREPGALRTTVLGLPVVVQNTRPDISTSQVLQRLELAFDLVRTHAPRRWRRLDRDLTGVVVQRFPCRAAYFPEARACLLELTFLAHPEISAAQVAASLVHEGVHARVAAMGVGSCADRAPREERLCRQAELEFGRVVPGGQAVVARALESLELADSEVAPAIDWQEAAARVRRADDL